MSKIVVLSSRLNPMCAMAAAGRALMGTRILASVAFVASVTNRC